ncbi:hepcidin [Hemicordylus capensis]|uniref:hepcidin n=1 Tax=Hemicordylus capensis TaxID=884348 RepID=UPI00230221D9|nr:hepcidin [Hemicordylus capensis]
MKLQLVAIIFILLSAATKNLCAFKMQTEAEKDLARLETQKSEILAETSGLQTLLRRSKRFNSHFPICTYCCNCCKNKGCGYCCRT